MSRPLRTQRTWLTRTVLIRTVLTLLSVAAVALLPALHLLWRLQPSHDLEVLVFDVTVVDGGYPEHAVLDKVLHHERVDFELGVDHVGAAPGGAAFGVWPTEQPELVILADGYGVYQNDDQQVDDFGRTLVSPTLSSDQAADVERWIANGVPAYGEFAFAPEPTPIEASEKFQRAFGFDSTGWLGHSQEDLALVSPNIAELGPSPWPYEGPGLIFVTTRAGDVDPEQQLVVLTASDLTSNLPVFIGGPAGSRGDRAPFASWFELVDPTSATVEAWLDLPVNKSGAAILAAAGIPTRWPGVLTTPTTVYVAGDGLDDNTGFAFRSFLGGDWLSYRLDDSPDERFFHQVLRPALSRTVDLAIAQREPDQAKASLDG